MKTDYSEYWEQMVSKRGKIGDQASGGRMNRRQTSRNGSSAHSGRRTDRSSDRATLGQLVRTLILAVALFGIPTAAVYWDRVPEVTEKIAALLHLNKAVANEPIIEHHAEATETKTPVESSGGSSADSTADFPADASLTAASMGANGEAGLGKNLGKTDAIPQNFHSFEPTATSEAPKNSWDDSSNRPYTDSLSDAPPFDLSLVPEEQGEHSASRQNFTASAADQSSEAFRTELARFGIERSRLTRWGSGGNLWRCTGRTTVAATRAVREGEGIGRSPEAAVRALIQQLKGDSQNRF